MSRLSDLLNPAPTSSAVEGQEIVTAGDVYKPSKSHHRHQSITSPLEALAIAATTSLAEPSLTNAASPPGFSSYSHQPPPPPQDNSQTVHRPSYSSPPNNPVQQVSYSLYNQPGAQNQQSRPSMNGAAPNSYTPGNLQSSDKMEISPSLESTQQNKPQNTDSTSQDMKAPLLVQPKLKETQNPNEKSSRDEPVKQSVEKQPAEIAQEPSTDGASDTIKQEEVHSPTKTTAQSPAAASTPVISGPKAPKPRAKQKADTKKKENTNPAKKSAPKKRKIEAESRGDTPLSQRSGTPNSIAASKAVASKAANTKQNSATPGQSSPPVEDDGEDESGESDNELFCICRKPDDHTWMIGCDGGCEDWFHGRCVNMSQKDEGLIDKYICPNCSAKKGIETTWKAMCRLEGCRNAARAGGPNPSKYCCDEHGIQFMRQVVMNRAQKDSSDAPAKKRRKENYTDHIGNEDEQEPPHLRGGYLLPVEIKRIIGTVNEIGEFKHFGDIVPVPADTSDAAISDTNMDSKPSPAYSADEKEQLEKISSRRTRLRNQLESLDDREHFLAMVKTRAKSVLDELKKKEKNMKDICGFDRRLRWSDEDFDNWRLSQVGKEALKSRLLPASATEGTDPDGDVKMADGTCDSSEQIGQGVCQKKRCKQHDGWYKLHLQDLAFDRSDCRRAIRDLDLEEKGIRERAVIRSLESRSEA